MADGAFGFGVNDRDAGDGETVAPREGEARQEEQEAGIGFHGWVLMTEGIVARGKKKAKKKTRPEQGGQAGRGGIGG